MSARAVRIVARIVRATLLTLFWLCVGSCGLVVLLFSVLELPYARNLARNYANRSLSQMFKGKLIIDRIGSVGILSVVGIDAHVLDAAGNQVLMARGLAATSVWPRMIPALVRGGPLVITLDRASCDHVEVRLVDDGSGSPTLAEAFMPRSPKPSTGPSTTSIVMPAIRLRHVWVHGGLASVPTIDAELSSIKVTFSQRPSGTQAALDHMNLTARALPAHIDPSGTLTGQLSLPSAPDSRPSVSAAFDGHLVGAPSNVRARMQGSTVNAKLRVTNLHAKVLRDYVPSLTLPDPSTISADLVGNLPDLHLSAKADNPAVQIAIHGNAHLGASKSANVQVNVTRLDLGRIAEGFPTSDLRANLDANLDLASGGRVGGKYHATIPNGQLRGAVTPSLETSGTLALSEAGRMQLAGKLSIDEPGALAQLNYQFTSYANQRSAQGELSIQFTRPPRLQRLLDVTASGALLAKTRIDLSASKVSSTLILDVQPLISPSAAANSLQLRASVNGTLGNPRFTVASLLTAVQVADRRFPRVLVSIDGTRKECEVRGQVDQARVGGQRLNLRTKVALSNAAELIEPELTVSGDANPVTARARRILFGSGVTRLDHVQLTGAGELSVDGVLGSKHTDLDVNMSEVQLPQLLAVLGMKTELSKGMLTGKGHITGALHRLNGELNARIHELATRGLHGGEITVDVKVKDNTANGQLNATLGSSRIMTNIGDVDFPDASSSWLALRGQASVHGDVDLARMLPLLRAIGVPLQEASGELQLDIEARNARSGPTAPQLMLGLKTKGLRLVEQRRQPRNIETASAARATQPLALDGVDVDMHFLFDGASRKAQVGASLADKLGDLLRVNVASDLPDLNASPSLLQLESAPFKADILVPQRALEQLPTFARLVAVRGLVQAEVKAEGTILDPKLDAVVIAHGLRYRRVRNIEAATRAHFERESGELTAVAYERSRAVAQLAAQWKGSLLDKLRSEQGYSEFVLGSDLVLDQFPLGVVPALADHSIRGKLSGDVRLRDLGRQGSLTAHLDGSQLLVRDQKLAVLNATVQANDHDGMRAEIYAEQQPGRLQADIVAPLQWGNRLIPEFGNSAKGRIAAKQFRVEALSPLLVPTVSEFQGRLDANLDIELADGTPRLQGTANFDQGVVEVPQIGQRFSDVAARVSIAGSDIRLDSLQARGTTGRVNVHGHATLNGTDLQAANASIDIGSKEKLPVTFEGVEVGDAWGHLDFTYNQSQSDTQIRVNVPSFHMQLPDQSMASVQSLAPDDHVQVGMFGPDGKFAAIPVQPLETAKSDDEGNGARTKRATKVEVRLGDSVWIDRPDQAKVQLSGGITITAGEPTRIDGKIELRGGTLDVNGKTFHIESGTVAFTGTDSTNPTITATARWDSPAGYTVYAQYAGTVKDGKLTLRAEPPLTQNEIISLLLFGSPEGALGSSSGGGSAAATALGVAGGTATKGFNRVMNDFTHLDVSARIDTSTGSARPELVVQVTPRLTTRVTRALGEPAPGQSPDRTFLTMELRLKRAWALSAVVGDRGASSLDLIWRHRY